MHRSGRLDVTSLMLMLIHECITAPAAAGRTPAGGSLNTVTPQKRIQHIIPNNLTPTAQEIRESKQTTLSENINLPQASLYFTQYSRKDFRGENTAAGRYHIMAKVTNAGKLLGSTGGALVAWNGSVKFPITAEQGTHDVRIEVPVWNFNPNVDRDDEPIDVVGVPALGDVLYSSLGGCDVSDWQPVEVKYDWERMATLGYRRRDIQCLR
ncbi:MAG: hypothetical protein Q9207_007328 [Kuettlingeria erythrocarpa]